MGLKPGVTEAVQTVRPDVLVMPAQQFDALVAALDEPDPAPALARALAKIASRR